MEKSSKTEDMEKTKTSPVEDIEKTDGAEEVEESREPEDMEKTSPVEEMEESSKPEDMEKTSPVDDIEKIDVAEEVEESREPEDMEKTSPVEEMEESSKPEDMEKTSPVDDIEKIDVVEEMDKSIGTEDIEKTDVVEEIEKSSSDEKAEKSSAIGKKDKGNSMRNVRIEKITLNVGAGKDTGKLEKGMKLIKHLTGFEPVKTITNKKIASWGLRPGLPIGCKLTIRNGVKKELVEMMLRAKDNILKDSNFDNNGSISFGIHEYIDIPGVEYNPDVGIMGIQICITLERPGYRVKRRRIGKSKISKKHIVTKEDAIEFMEKEFGVQFA